MDIFIYIMVLILGTVFGSFFTLAIYRIPLKKDITHERSFCPNCNHRLEFLDLIPVLSYLFLGGKCRYCGNKIRIRYLLLEILSGIVFLIGYISLNMHFPYFPIPKIAYFISFLLMYVTLVIVGGIDKENRIIHKGVIVFGIICQTIYAVYLNVFEKSNLYHYLLYIFAIIVVFCIDKLIQKNKNKSSYALQVIILILYLNLCIGADLFLPIAILAILEIILFCIISSIKYNANDNANILKENIKEQVPIAFFICATTIIITITENFLIFYK